MESESMDTTLNKKFVQVLQVAPIRKYGSSPTSKLGHRIICPSFYIPCFPLMHVLQLSLNIRHWNPKFWVCTDSIGRAGLSWRPDYFASTSDPNRVHQIQLVLCERWRCQCFFFFLDFMVGQDYAEVETMWAESNCAGQDGRAERPACAKYIGQHGLIGNGSDWMLSSMHGTITSCAYLIPPRSSGSPDLRTSGRSRLEHKKNLTEGT